ncbi:transposase [Rhodococcus sp. NPDC003318]|uniref:IS110 family transposase n=1 Tax=Rhodococcus sp. NPDC003318 TaxID=3364503 RepID=UPI0036970D07
MPIVADQYRQVIGVDTHAATHTLTVVTAATGAPGVSATFPTSTTGLDRARDWIARCAEQGPTLVVVEGIGSYGAVLTDRLLAAGFPVVEPAAMAAADRRGVGKTDALDAVRIARSVLSIDLARLRTPRADGPRVGDACPRRRPGADDLRTHPHDQRLDSTRPHRRTRSRCAKALDRKPDCNSRGMATSGGEPRSADVPGRGDSLGEEDRCRILVSWKDEHHA